TKRGQEAEGEIPGVSRPGPTHHRAGRSPNRRLLGFGGARPSEGRRPRERYREYRDRGRRTIARVAAQTEGFWVSAERDQARAGGRGRETGSIATEADAPSRGSQPEPKAIELLRSETKRGA